MLGLQRESSHLPTESLFPNMYMESLPLAISTSEVWLECSYTLLDKHFLTLLMLPTVLQDMFYPGRQLNGNVFLAISFTASTQLRNYHT
ncbi:hypothetical protein ACHAXS_002290 [Conticribra weissflogii]